MSGSDHTSALDLEVRSFIDRYAALFASPRAAVPDGIAEIAAAVAEMYRPGVTFFTDGQIARFETRQDSARLIEREMRKAWADGLGVCLVLQDVHTVAYSETAVTCYLEWEFRTPKEGPYKGINWRFTNIYGYRAATGESGDLAGWEYVVRDNEVSGMRNATGKIFN